MLRKHIKKLNNKAFTLIEILIAVALLAVVTVSIGAVIISTQNNTSRMLSESELQQQLVTTQDAVQNEILATNAGIKYWVKQDPSSVWTTINKDAGGEYEKLVAFYSLDTSDFVLTKTYYLYNSKDKTMKTAKLYQSIPKNKDEKIVVKVDDDVEQTLVSIESWTLMSSKLENFSINFTNYDRSNLIEYSLEIKQDGISYPASDTVYLRNNVNINSDLQIEKYHSVKLSKPTLENTVFIYDGLEHGPTEIEYYERFITRTENSTVSAIDVGVYHITYRLKDKNATTWEDGTTTDVTLTWTINKKVVGLIWGETSWVYDGQEHSTTCTPTNVADGDVCNIILENNSIGPDVGTVECIARTDNPNYSVPSSHSVTLRITNALPTVTMTTVDRTYNGQLQTLVSYENLVGGTLRYYVSTEEKSPLTEQVQSITCEAKDAGIYHIWYRIVAINDNYSDTEAIYLGSAKIARLATATISSSDKTYNGSEQQGVDGNFILLSGNYKAVNAGTYTAFAEPDPNHLWTDGTYEQKSITWNINKATGAVIAPIAKTNLVYNGEEQILIDGGTTPYGSVYYKVNNGEWSKVLPVGKNAGTYKIYYYSSGDDNHYETSRTDNFITVTIARKPSAFAAVENKTYNGLAQSCIARESNVVWGRVYSATDAGKYVASATPTENYAWEDGKYEERTFEWEIKKTSGSIVPPTAKNLTYNGGEQVLVNTGSTPYGEVLYKVGVDGEYSATLPTAVNAGQYIVYYYSTGDNNHEPTDAGSVAVTIQRRATATASYVNRTYNGQEQSGIYGEHVTWSGVTKATNAGTYAAYATPAENYMWPDGTFDSKPIAWTISKASGEMVAPTAKTLTYNGTSQTLINAGSTQHGVVYYKLNADGVYGTALPSATDAGTYTIYYYASGDDNHDATTEQSMQVTINRNPVATALSANKTYNGTTQTGVSGNYISWTGITSAIDAGTYAAYATPTANYAWEDGSVGAKTITWTISRQTIATASALNPTYNGGSQTGVTGSYVTWSGTISAIDAGTYTAYATPTSNYAWPDGTYGQATIVWNMNKTSGSVSAPTAKSLTYNGSAQQLVNAGSTSYGSIYYRLGDSGGFSTTIPSATDAGTYTVYYYSSGDANHNATAIGSISVTISRNPIATASQSNKTYTGSAQTGVAGSYVSWSGTTSATNAGTYTAYATPSANYAWSDGTAGTKTITWAMARKPSATASTANKTYNGDAQTGVTGSNVSWTGYTSRTNAGTYIAYATPNDNYAWSDGTYDTIEVEWEIYRAKTATASGKTLSPTGSAQTGVAGSNVTWTGTRSATNPGTYTAYATPKDNYAWSDGTTDTKTVTWKINGYLFAVGDSITMKNGAGFYANSGSAVKKGTASYVLNSNHSAVISKFYNSSGIENTSTHLSTEADKYCIYVSSVKRNGSTYYGPGYFRLDEVTK